MKILYNIKKKFRFIKKTNLLFNIYRLIFYRKQLTKEAEIFSQLKNIENYNDKEIYSLQEKKLLSVLKYAYFNTLYYKNLFEQNNIDVTNIKELKSIPILTKNIIRTNKNELYSKEFKKSDLIERNTGGSTGEPLEFHSDREGGLIDNAHHWYLYSLMGYTKWDRILSAVGNVVPIKLRDQNVFWIKDSKYSVWGEYKFSVLYITDSNIKYYIEKLLSIKPSILRGYPSFFDKLAIYILENDIKIDFNIKGINLTSEMCSESQRINIEKAFSSMVYFEYGHTEICLYCYTNDTSYIYQSSPIYGYIEVIDADGHDVEIGEIGNIIVTGFNNYGMPFIRYNTGDMGEVYSRNGGVIHFKKIVGRSQDYIISKDNQKVFLTALIFGQHLKAFKNIMQWQLIQNNIGIIIIIIIQNKLYSHLDEEDIINNFKSVTNVDLIFNYVDNIPLTKRGKHLFLIQNIGKNNEF